MTDDFEKIATAAVAKWEHGDELHRQWLRETAIPDVVALLEAERAAAIARLQAVVSFAESIHPEITQYDSWRRIAGAPGMAPIAP